MSSSPCPLVHVSFRDQLCNRQTSENVWLVLTKASTCISLIKPGACIISVRINTSSQIKISSLLPVRELDRQHEQHAEHDSPAEQIRSPGHQKQHLPETLPHPAQHYRLPSALRLIYTSERDWTRPFVSRGRRKTGWTRGRSGPWLDTGAVRVQGVQMQSNQPFFPT